MGYCLKIKLHFRNLLHANTQNVLRNVFLLSQDFLVDNLNEVPSFNNKHFSVLKLQYLHQTQTHSIDLKIYLIKIKFVYFFLKPSPHF